MMNHKHAVNAFAALGNDARLALYRQLVEAGPEGLSAGELADSIRISPSSLTFHIAQLERARLVSSRREGRYVIYSADFEAMGGLVDFLTQKCCKGHPEVCRGLQKKGAKAS